MSRPFEGPQPTAVRMTPQLTPLWERTDLPSKRASLFVAPGCPSNVIDNILCIDARTSVPWSDYDKIGEGGFASVYQRDEVAYKVHDFLKLDSMYPISDFVANIALSAGFKRPECEDGMRPLSHHGRVFRFSAPEYYAALVPYHPWRSQVKSTSGFIIAMSMEYGVEPLPHEVPDTRQRVPYYQAAVRAAGLHPDDVQYDDTNRGTREPRNILIGQAPGETALTLTKLDVMAGSDFAAHEFGIV